VEKALSTINRLCFYVVIVVQLIPNLSQRQCNTVYFVFENTLYSGAILILPTKYTCMPRKKDV
jgi:hypothetical protein